ncbi:hypothetical protein BU17DRAFT_90726 [Hysterangium stoloniferum]|nr:hypothetical protein BU17DRAFT_90726 [Hysterangium stoloniferum]
MQWKSKISSILQELDITEDETGDVLEASILLPWRKQFVDWMERKEYVTESMGSVAWYPVWASLTLNYLSIMVSSECAFSAGGITTKRRNRLIGGIIEALQVIKCALHKSTPSALLNARNGHNEEDV